MSYVPLKGITYSKINMITYHHREKLLENRKSIAYRGLLVFLYCLCFVVSKAFIFGKQNISWIFELSVLNYINSLTFFSQKSIDAALNGLKGV